MIKRGLSVDQSGGPVRPANQIKPLRFPSDTRSIFHKQKLDPIRRSSFIFTQFSCADGSTYCGGLGGFRSDFFLKPSAASFESEPKCPITCSFAPFILIEQRAHFQIQGIAHHANRLVRVHSKFVSSCNAAGTDNFCVHTLIHDVCRI
jgi:hypothetical protein